MPQPSRGAREVTLPPVEAGTPAPAVSVVVRAKNEAAGLGRTLSPHGPPRGVPRPLVEAGTPTPAVSVVVRAKNEAADIGRTLSLLNEQDLGGRAVEVIVVDSGSSDGTQRIALEHGARLVEIPPESFTFGGSLNTGCEHARAAIIVALSAHAFPPDKGWLARVLAW